MNRPGKVKRIMHRNIKAAIRHFLSIFNSGPSTYLFIKSCFLLNKRFIKTCLYYVKVHIQLIFCSEDGEEYTGSRSSVIISSQISDDFMTFLGNSSVILNFTHNVSNRLLDLCNNYVYTQFLHLVSLFNENDKNITYRTLLIWIQFTPLNLL